MKKNLILLIIGLVAVFQACSEYTDVEPGGTAVEKMTGTWIVTFEQSVAEYDALFNGGTDPNLKALTVDELNKLEWSDLYENGKVSVITSNTASNTSTGIWMTDHDFKDTKVKYGVMYDALTFEDGEALSITDSVTMVSIKGGKILEGASIAPSGTVGDSIVAYIMYSNERNNFTYMKMSGYRYTGYTEDK